MIQRFGTIDKEYYEQGLQIQSETEEEQPVRVNLTGLFFLRIICE